MRTVAILRTIGFLWFIFSTVFTEHSEWPHYWLIVTDFLGCRS